MTDVLGKLFGGVARVKILRLFILNPNTSLSHADIAQRARVLPSIVRRELLLLLSVGLIKRAAAKAGKRTQHHFILDEEFTHLIALRDLLTNAPVAVDEVRKRLKSVGAVRLIIVAGLFLGDFDGRIDILLVGDRVNQTKLTAAVRLLESSVGKELRYALLSTSDFRYRLGLHDRLIRDVFDYQHKIVLDRLNIHLPS